MDAAHRARVAAAGRRLLPALLDAVVESWDDLLADADTWDADRRRAAREATAAALAGMVDVFERGDLDDRSWARVRDAVLRGRDREDAAELLRSARLVAVDLLADHLERSGGLTLDARWELQREAAVFCDALLDVHSDPDPAAFDELLIDLERSGPDYA